MVEEYYYLDRVSGEMLRTKGWEKGQFRLFYDGEIWCPRHNRFEYIWNELQGDTVSSRQCIIKGFPIREVGVTTFYGCRILKANNETPIQLTFYTVTPILRKNTVKFIRRQVRCLIDMGSGKYSVQYPGKASIVFDTNKMLCSPDNQFKEYDRICSQIRDIGYDMPQHLEKRILELISDNNVPICSMSGFECFLAMVERPNEPNITQMKNFIGRHYFELFPVEYTNNYERMAEYIGMQGESVEWLRPYYNEYPFVMIVVRLLYEVGIEGFHEVSSVVKVLCENKLQTFYGIPIYLFQLLPCNNLRLSVIETEYDYEALYDEVLLFLKTILSHRSEHEVIKHMINHLSVEDNGQKWIVGDVLHYYNLYSEILSADLRAMIREGNIGIQIYHKTIMELAERKKISLCSSFKIEMNKFNDELYGYSFSTVLTSNELERIMEELKITPLSSEEDGRYNVVAIYKEKVLEAACFMNGKRIDSYYIASGEKISGRLRTACRVWAKKNGCNRIFDR